MASIMAATHLRMERWLANVLSYGTWVASGIIGAGLVVDIMQGHAKNDSLLSGMHLVTAGIGLLILLPTLRVLMMLVVFALDRDYRFTAISALVLTIILLGFMLGMQMPSVVA
jgi:uncharacterized membrane protein